MKSKKGQKIISAILLVFMIISQFGGVYAAQIGETEDLVSLFHEAGKTHDDKVDALFYVINHADYTNPTVVESIDDYINEYM